MKRNHCYLLFCIILFSCNHSKNKQAKKVPLNTRLVKVTRTDIQSSTSLRVTISVDKEDYKIIQHLDTLDNSSYRVNIRTNDQGKIFYLLIKTRFDYKIPLENRVKKWEKLQKVLFEPNKFSLSKLDSLKALNLYLFHFQFPLQLKIPDGLQELRVLEVMFSSLESISFPIKNKLTLLILENNQIKSLNNVLPNLRHLNYLRIASNKLSRIEIDTTVNQNMRHLDLTSNPLQVPIDSIRKRYPGIGIYYNEENAQAIQ